MARANGRAFGWRVLFFAVLVVWIAFLVRPPAAPVWVEALVLGTLVAFWLPVQVLVGRCASA